MKRIKYLLAVVLIISLAGAGVPVNNKYTLSKGYAFSINGTSNLHDWDEKVETVTGNGIIDWNTDGTFNVAALNINLTVRSIKSTKGSVMNNNTYKALKADAHPYIVFTLTAPVKSVAANGETVTAKINLSIAGVTKTVNMSVKAASRGRGNITFEGSQTIKMTDYGITPPRALLGTLKTGNEITIHFKTNFAVTAN
jgi:polyisoprenoid-binding protein YceI